MSVATFNLTQLDELDRLMKAAWPGPWEVHDPAPGGAWPLVFSDFIHTQDGMLLENRANIGAIVALVNAYPQLRAALRAQKEGTA